MRDKGVPLEEVPLITNGPDLIEPTMEIIKTHREFFDRVIYLWDIFLPHASYLERRFILVFFACL